MNRRQLIQRIPIIAVGSAGCMEFDPKVNSDTKPKTGRETTISAEPTLLTIDSTTLEETGYEKTRDVLFELTQTVSGDDESYSVEASNHLIRYDRTVDHIEGEKQSVAVFAAVVTPKVEAASEEVDLTEQVTNEIIENRLQVEYGTIRIEDEAYITHSITPFENEVTVYQYPGVAEASDYKVEVYVHVARILRESDYVTLVGLYPYFLNDDEQYRILDLMEAVE